MLLSDNFSESGNEFAYSSQTSPILLWNIILSFFPSDRGFFLLLSLVKCMAHHSCMKNNQVPKTQKLIQILSSPIPWERGEVRLKHMQKILSLHLNENKTSGTASYTSEAICWFYTWTSKYFPKINWWILQNHLKLFLLSFYSYWTEPAEIQCHRENLI